MLEHTPVAEQHTCLAASKGPLNLAAPAAELWLCSLTCQQQDADRQTSQRKPGLEEMC